MEQPPPDGRTRHGSHGYEVTQARGSQVVSRSPSGRNSPSTPPKRVKLSNRFKRLLATATTLPVLALILMVCTTFSPQWERVEFAFDKVVRFACSTPASQSRTWSLAYLILETGSRIPFDKNEVHACREACGRLFNRTQAGEAQKSVVGAGLLKLSTNANTTSNTTTLIEVYNMLAGVFQVCYKTQVPMERGLMAIIKAPLRTSASCFNYILNGPRWKGSGCRLMMLSESAF
uniref:Transmembrane protein n=1 Tax=Mesocestoides corti TaxID=53468 RepID=A0A5K3FGP4_MESCO